MKPLKTAIAVCEYNPFHTGHKLHLDTMRKNADIVAVIMSGNFCQRGEVAIMDKYARARHAILNGADIVFELPTVFAISPAEVFASGAIKLIDSLPGDKTLYFGAERGTEEDFLKIANLFLYETKEFKDCLKEKLTNGLPYVVAKMEAYKQLYPHIDFSITDTPNSVLGVEYTKALIKNGSHTKIMPVNRPDNYNKTDTFNEFCSSSAIRNAIKTGELKKIKKFVSGDVYSELPKKLPYGDDLMIFKAIQSKPSDLQKIIDCTEGLENRIKAKAVNAKDLDDFINKLETKRYTRARLKRIIMANLLGVTKELVEKCLKSNLYLKVLAVAGDKVNLLSLYSGNKNKLITRKADTDNLKGTAKICFLKDVYANNVYNLITKKHTNEYEMKIVKR